MLSTFERDNVMNKRLTVNIIKNDGLDMGHHLYVCTDLHVVANSVETAVRYRNETVTAIVRPYAVA